MLFFILHNVVHFRDDFFIITKYDGLICIRDLIEVAICSYKYEQGNYFIN